MASIAASAWSSMEPLPHPVASIAVRERRLSALLAERPHDAEALRDAVEDALVAGSLELAGVSTGAEAVAAARRGDAPGPAAGLLRARRAVDPGAPLTAGVLLRWHAAIVGQDTGFRTGERERPGDPPPAPAAFVPGRVAILQEWLSAASGRQLAPARQGALALARIVEILPFEDGNGRLARLAAAHLMVRAGGRPPLLRAADAQRLVEALQAAFRFVTEPLTDLLEEASARALDVMIGVLEPGAGGA